jgi:hypothetical protein
MIFQKSFINLVSNKNARVLMTSYLEQLGNNQKGIADYSKEF